MSRYCRPKGMKTKTQRKLQTMKMGGGGKNRDVRHKHGAVKS